MVNAIQTFTLHQEPSRQKVASIHAVHLDYIATANCVPCTHFSYNSSCPDLICPVHREPSRQKVASIGAYIMAQGSNQK